MLKVQPSCKAKGRPLQFLRQLGLHSILKANLNYIAREKEMKTPAQLGAAAIMFDILVIEILQCAMASKGMVS